MLSAFLVVKHLLSLILSNMAIYSITKNLANIRVGSKWKGSCGSYRGFVRFSSFGFGVRALLVLLRTYRFKYRLLCVRDIITRYAPSNENPTEFYISYICERLFVKQDEILTDKQMLSLAYFILCFESGPTVCNALGVDLDYVRLVAAKYDIKFHH